MNIDGGSAAAPPALSDLRARLLALQGRKLSRQAFAGEVAGLVSEATGVEGVAVLVHNRRRQRLRLHATRGLPPDARSALAGETQEAWGIPLRALRNRRINVIESAHVNPFVPRALVALSPSYLTIACLPVYVDFEPAAVVLLFANRPDALNDETLQALHHALAVCGPALREPGARGSAAREGEEAAFLVDGDTGRAAAGAPADSAVAEQTGGLIDVLRAQVADLERDVQQARTDLERSTTAVRTLTGSRDALARERDRLTSQLAEVEEAQARDGKALRDEIAALEDRLAAVESERVKYQRQATTGRTAVQRSLKQVEAERDSAREQLTTAESRTARLQAESDGLARDRERLVAQLDTIRQLLEANQTALEQAQSHAAREASTLRGERDSWKDRAGSLQGQLVEQAERQRALQHDLRAVEMDRDDVRQRLEVTQAALEEHAQQASGTGAALVAERDRWREQAASLQAQLAERAELFRTQEHELQRVAAARADAQLQLDAKQAALEHTHRQYTEEIATLTAERDRWLTQASSLEARTAEAQRRLDDELPRAEAGRAAAEQALAGVRDDRDQLATALETLRATLQQVEAARDAADAERATLRARLDEERAGQLSTEQTWRTDLHAARTERDTLSGQLAAIRGELAARERRVEEQRQEIERLRADHTQATEAAAGAAALRAELANLRSALDGATTEHQRLTGALDATEQQLAMARRAPGEAARLLAEELDGTRRRLAEAEHQSDSLQAERDIAHQRARDAEQGVAQLRTKNAEWQGQRDAVAAERADLTQRLDAAERTAKAQAEQLAAESRRAAELTERCTELAHALAADNAQRNEIHQQVVQARNELQDMRRALAEAQSAAAAAEARAAAAAVEHQQTQAALAERETRRAAAEAALQQTRTEAQLLGQQSSDRAALARQTAELGAKVAELEHLLEAARADAEAARRAANESQQQFTRTLEEATRQRVEEVATAQRERDHLRAELERSAADQEHRATERAAQAAQASDLQQLRALLAAVERDRDAAVAGREAQQTETTAMLERLAEERRQLQAQYDQYRQAQMAERAATTARLITLDAALTEARRARDEVQLERDLAARQAAAPAAGSEHREQIEALSGALREREELLLESDAERRRLETRLQAADASAADVSRERRDLHRQLDATVDEVEQMRQQHAEEIETLQRSFAAKLEEERKTALGRETRARESAQLAQEQKRTARGETLMMIERSTPVATPAPEPAAPPTKRAAAPGAEADGEIMLLDDGEARDMARNALKEFGIQPHLIAATAAAVDEIARRKLKSVLLNLGGGASAWHALKELRERVATRTVPILAYLMTPDLHTGFSFGRADFGVWPLDTTRIVERLRILRPKLRRVLVVSADIEGMGRLREPLAKAGIGASMALDGKQAQDLANSIQPEAAILHLSPTCPDIGRALAFFRIGEPSLQLPLLVLLDKTAPREDDFFTKTTLELLRRGSFNVGRLGEEFIRVFS